MNSATLSRITAFALVLALGACASSPAYVPADSADDYGHYSTRLDENRYRIVYNGRRSTSLNEAKDLALLRAAELTLDQGKDWFQVVDRESSTRYRDRPATHVAYEQAYHVDRRCGLLGCTSSVHPDTRTHVGVETGTAETRVSHALEIVMGTGAMPTASGNYYDASSVAQSLWASL